MATAYSNCRSRLAIKLLLFILMIATLAGELALPGSDASSPAVLAQSPVATLAANLPAGNFNPEDLRAGRQIYARSCAQCHGPKGEGVSGSVSPLSGVTDLDLIRRIVRQGSVKMPPMQTLLTAQQIEQVSRFVAVELNKK
jgi:mono/diheme cytochrome c family protein